MPPGTPTWFAATVKEVIPAAAGASIANGSTASCENLASADAEAVGVPGVVLDGAADTDGLVTVGLDDAFAAGTVVGLGDADSVGVAEGADVAEGEADSGEVSADRVKGTSSADVVGDAAVSEGTADSTGAEGWSAMADGTVAKATASAVITAAGRKRRRSRTGFFDIVSPNPQRPDHGDPASTMNLVTGSCGHVAGCLRFADDITWPVSGFRCRGYPSVVTEPTLGCHKYSFAHIVGIGIGG